MGILVVRLSKLILSFKYREPYKNRTQFLVKHSSTPKD